MSFILPVIFLVIMVAIAAFVISKYQTLKVFFEEVAFVMGKVAWPTRDEVINSTIMVWVATIALTVVVMVVDSVIGKAVQLLF